MKRDDLAIWLDAHRQELSPLWADVIDKHAPLLSDDQLDKEISAATLTGPAVNIDQLYELLLQSASGDYSGLDTHVHAITFDSDIHHQNMSTRLSRALEIREYIVAHLRQEISGSAYIQQLSNEVNALFDRLIINLVTNWEAYAFDSIREREFIAESLDSASASADQRALQLKALGDISLRLSASLERNQLLELMVTSLYRLTAIEHIAVWLPSEEDPNVLVATYTSDEDTACAQVLQVDPGSSQDLTCRAFCTGRIQFEITPDVSQQGEWYRERCGVQALPMLMHDQVIGVVTLQDPNPVEQLRFQQDLVQGVINQTTIALQNAHLYTEVRMLNVVLEQRVEERTRQLQEERDRLATINAISAEVSSNLDLNSLLTTSLTVVASILQAEHASIMLVEQDDSSLLVTRAVYGGPPSLGNSIRLPIGSGIAGWVAQQRKGALVNDVSIDERWVSIPGGSLRKREGSMIAMPLLMQGDVIGVISLLHHQPGFFQEGHMRLVTACAGPIAIGINNANLFQMITAEAERRYELLDRQQIEASQLEAILQNLSDGVIVCDLYGSVRMANQAAGIVLGRPVEDLLLWNLHDIITRYLGPRSSEMHLSELLARPLDAHDQRRIFALTAKVGLRMVSMTMGPVLKEDGQLLGALLVARDITREANAIIYYALAQGLNVGTLVQIGDYKSLDLSRDEILQRAPDIGLALIEFEQVSANIHEYQQSTAPALRRNSLSQATTRIEQTAQITQDIAEPFGPLLRLIVERWRALIAEESGRLARAEIGGPVPNPYVAGNPVRGDLFVGREDVMRRLRELWAGPGQRPSVILFGHRRMGKSSILRNLGQWLDTDTTVVDFNLQRISLVDSSNDLLYALTHTLFEALPLEVQAAVGAPDEGRFIERSPYTALDQYLRLVGAHHGGRRFIVAIDEFEKIEEWITAGRVEPQLLDALRGQIQTYPWLVLALAGLHTLEEMTHDYWNPLFGSVTAIPVSFLSPAGARRLITQPSPDFAINYSPEAIEQIVTLTNGQPYLLQLIGHALVTRFNRQTFEAGIERERRFTQADVEAVIGAPEFHRDGHAYFDGVWNQARQSRPAGQPEILRALAAAPEGLSEQALAERAGLSRPEAQAALATLVAHDVVRRGEDRICYSVELMRRWVAAL